MKKIFKYTLAAITMAVSGNTLAQNPYSAYFMDGYAYGHELNPAKDYDRNGYVGLFWGNFNFAVRGNLGLQDIFYPNPNGKGLVTYLHPSLTTEKALSGFSKNNKLLSDIRMDIVSFGFHSKNSFQTFTIGLRANVGVNIPYGLFEMTKSLKNQNYDISDLGATAKAWMEMGWGYSRNIGDLVRVGGKLKLLLGGSYVNFNMDKLNLDLSSPEQWVATAEASAELGIKSATWGQTKATEYSDGYKETHPGATTYESIDLGNIDVPSPGLGGMGLGIDLGAEVDLNKTQLVPGLTVSAAINDLGFIRWADVATAKNTGDKQFKFNGFDNIKVKDGEGVEFEDQSDDLSDQLSDLMGLQDAGTGSKITGLGATLNIGAEYRLPMYQKLGFGLLSTTRIQSQYSWNEERVSVNYHPAKWFEFGVNVGFGTLGSSFGWVFNLHPRGINIFLAGDHMLGKVSKQFIPLKSNADIALGFNFPIGKSKK